VIQSQHKGHGAEMKEKHFAVIHHDSGVKAGTHVNIQVRFTCQSLLHKSKRAYVCRWPDYMGGILNRKATKVEGP